MQKYQELGSYYDILGKFDFCFHLSVGFWFSVNASTDG